MSTNRPNKNTNNKEYKQTSVDRSVIDDFNARIKKNPDDASAYLNRGLVYHTLGSYDQAIEDFNKAIQLMPDLNTHVKPLLEEAIQKNHNDLKNTGYNFSTNPIIFA